MPLPGNPWKLFQVTADDTNLLSGDQALGSRGKGWWGVRVAAAAAADGTITVNDSDSDVLATMAIPVRAAAVTYPEIRLSDDPRIIFKYTGEGQAPVINVADGTNAEIVALVEYGGAGVKPVWPL